LTAAFFSPIIIPTGRYNYENPSGKPRGKGKIARHRPEFDAGEGIHGHIGGGDL
jgi:hypothetical protein